MWFYISNISYSNFSKMVRSWYPSPTTSFTLNRELFLVILILKDRILEHWNLQVSPLEKRARCSFKFISPSKYLERLVCLSLTTLGVGSPGSKCSLLIFNWCFRSKTNWFGDGTVPRNFSCGSEHSPISECILIWDCKDRYRWKVKIAYVYKNYTYSLETFAKYAQSLTLVFHKICLAHAVISLVSFKNSTFMLIWFNEGLHVAWIGAYALYESLLGTDKPL